MFIKSDYIFISLSAIYEKVVFSGGGWKTSFSRPLDGKGHFSLQLLASKIKLSMRA